MNDNVKINGKEYGFEPPFTKGYKIVHGRINGVNNVYIEYDNYFIRDNEEGTYTLLRNYEYNECKQAYLSCLKKTDEEAIDCFKARQYKIMKACYKYMIPWSYFNKE